MPTPTNQSDTDLTGEMDALLWPQSGITGSTFGITVDLSFDLAARLQYENIEQLGSSSSDFWLRCLQFVPKFDGSIGAELLTHCQMNVPMQWTIEYTTRAFPRPCHLLVVRPMTRAHRKDPLPLIMSSQEILDLALQSLRAEELFYQTQLVKGFWSCTWNQWYVLAVALVEICRVFSMCQNHNFWSVT